MSGTVGPRLSTIIPTFLNNYSFEFDGTDDKVITSSAIVGSDITLSGWYNLNAASYTAWQYQFATCIAPSNSSASNAALGKFYKRGSQMEIGVQAYDQNSANYSTYAVRVQLEGAGWNHVVWTYNDTTKHIYCYLNGVAQTWTNYGGTITTPYLTGNPTHLYGSNLIMGVISPTSTTGFFSGLLDEVSTYDRILTPSEITGIYNGGTPNDLTSLSPYGWWRNGDNSLYKDPQWLLPSNENKDKVSNYSMSFDGTDDAVTMGNVLNMADDGTDAYSFSIWFKTTDNSTQQLIGKSATNGYNLYTISGTIYFGLGTYGGGGIWGYTGIGSGVYNGSWQHLVLTYDGSQDISGFTIYYNNVAKVVSISQNTTPIGVSTANHFMIGARGNTGTPSLEFDGNIDEASYFNSELTVANVSTIYNSGVPNDISTLSPLGWWRLGDESTFSTNWTIKDQGSGGNDGTSANMDINDRIGDAPGSENNALSYNMVLSGRTSDVPT